MYTNGSCPTGRFKKGGCLIRLILPPTHQGGLFMSLVFNKSPLGDLGVVLKEEAFDAASCGVKKVR